MIAGNKLKGLPTERKQVEERLQLAAVVFENATSGLMVIGADGIIQSVNPAFTAITGYDREEVIGKDVNSFQCCDSDCNTVELIAYFLKENDQQRGETWATRKNGGRCLMGYNATAIRNDQGEITDYIFVCQDITEEARLREEKRQFQDQINHMHRLASLNALSAGVVHEIARPLNAISVLAEGMLYMLKRGKFMSPDRRAEKLQGILDETERINGLIQHIRSFAHAGYAEALAPCNINRAIEKALDILGGQLSACGISVQRVLADGLAQVEGIDNGLEEVVINLLVNALEAFNEASCSKKEIIVTTCQVGRSVALEVSDNATGIKNEDRTMIFEPLFSTKRPGKSMGLGLYIVRSLVDKFKGNIVVSNNEKGGATFRVELPALKGTGACLPARERGRTSLHGKGAHVLEECSRGVPPV